MRIVSKRRDYYDGVQREGQDQGLIYVRKPIRVDLGDSYQFRSMKFYCRHEFKMRSHIVGFCGKVYPVIQLATGDAKDVSDLSVPAAKIGMTTCYTIDDVDEFFFKNVKKKDLVDYHKPWKGWYSGSRINRVHFERFLGTTGHEVGIRNVLMNPLKLFDEYKAPLFMATYASVRDYQLVINTEDLKDVEFYRVFDPYQAFQEISMFFSNMAMPEKPIPHVDDKTMAGAKGFDKFSFRKEKQK